VRMVQCPEICFWCGEFTGRTSVFEATSADDYDIQGVLGSYEPCPTCQRTWSLGVVLFEVVDEQSSPRPPITPGYAPTGRWFIVPPETIREYFDYPEQVIATGKGIIDPVLADYLMECFMQGQVIH
jgi:hypothetical protein